MNSLGELKSEVEGGLSGIPRAMEPDLEEVRVSDLIGALEWAASNDNTIAAKAIFWMA